MIKSPITRYGGKYNMRKELLKHIPPHKCFVEVFCGAAHLYFAKEQAKMNVVNDLDSDIANLFRVLQDPELYFLFLHKLKYQCYSREMYVEYQKRYKTETDPFERAFLYFVCINLSFAGSVNGGFSTCTHRSRRGPAITFKNRYERLENSIDLLRSAVIENLDFEKCIQLYDTQDTFFYCDPPYVHKTRRNNNYYEHEMTEDEHKNLVQILRGIEGKYLLSGYENEIYASLPLIAKYEKVTCTGTPGKRQRTECLWGNYVID